jgi:Tfp pilus assembly protein PilF
LVGALLGVGLIPLGVIWILVWYQHDRPLRDIDAALKKGETSRALKLAGQFLRDHPDDVRAEVLRARILVDAGQLTDALRVFHRVGASDVADLHAWAKAHLLRQEWSDALPVLERLLAISPDDPDALHEITACRSFLGKYHEAFDSAKRLSALPGHEARAWLQIGTLHENLGNDRSAIEAWEKVLQYQPRAGQLQVTAADFFGEFGRVLLKDGRPERARDALERSLQSRETPEILSILGQACQQLGDEAQAVSRWKRAVELAPALREPREFLAQDAFRRGEFAEARIWLDPVVSQTKPPSSSTYLMQRICQALDERDAARSWQERTNELRKREKLQSAINHTLIEAPDSFWARAIRAYQFAESGNWHQADFLTRELSSEAGKEPFVRDLAECVRNRGPLPSLELLPVHQF